MRISYFREKKNHKKTLLKAKKVVLQNRSIWVSKNPEFYANFGSAEIIQKKCTGKELETKTIFSPDSANF
jgi:hypothetical protein